MNVQEAGRRITASTRTDKPFADDRSSLQERTAAVAKAAAADVEEVDRAPAAGAACVCTGAPARGRHPGGRHRASRS